MTLRYEKRKSIGLMLYRNRVMAHAHHSDKPHSWSTMRFLTLWIGYGFGSLIIDFK